MVLAANGTCVTGSHSAEPELEVAVAVCAAQFRSQRYPPVSSVVHSALHDSDGDTTLGVGVAKGMSLRGGATWTHVPR